MEDNECQVHNPCNGQQYHSDEYSYQNAATERPPAVKTKAADRGTAEANDGRDGLGFE
jgi:hypothetical protein